MLRIKFVSIVVVLLASSASWGGAVISLDAPGATVNANLGFRAISQLGDITGDGYPEILIGAYRTTAGRAAEEGAAHVFDGRSGAHVLTLHSPNPEFGGWFGHSVLGFPDITGDGIAEIVVAADAETPPGAPRFSGRVYIFDGATQALVNTLVSANPTTVSQFGISLGVVPDTNNDGIAELLVGAFRETVGGVGEAGRAYLHDGATGALLLTLNSPTPEAFGVFGVVVAGMPDITGDGAGDLLIGASSETSRPLDIQLPDVPSAGNAYLMDGVSGALLHTLTSPQALNAGAFAFDATAIPDASGDGLPDVAVGALLETTAGILQAGAVHIFDSGTGGLLSSLHSPRPETRGQFGVWVAPLHDISGNGFPELLVGAPGESEGCAAVAGRAYIFDVQGGQVLREVKSPLPQAGGAFAFSLTTLPDANGDQREEIAISALGEASNGLAGAGRAHVFYSPLLSAGDPGSNHALCRGNCPNDSPDADGDGLTACVEQCLGSSDAATDSDFDGMPDRFEADFGLDLVLDDAAGDRDGDGLSNLEEFLRASSPLNPRDPAPVHFIRIDGVDDPAGGTLDDPWRSVGFALAQVNGTAQVPARIVILCGEYFEEITLKPFVSLEGSAISNVVLHGAIRGAEGAGLRQLTLRAGLEDFLLLADAPSMKVSDVQFFGNGFASLAGIRVEGTGTASLLVEGCSFADLQHGLSVAGAMPAVRRCIFERCFEAGILIESLKDAPGFPMKALGDATDPRTGWNTFRDNTGKNIENQTATPIPAELNDWNTESVEAIANSIEGPADFEPFLPVGKALLASSLFCTVWEQSSATPVRNAEVLLTPSSYPPVTENTEGVYAYPALAGSTYDLEVSAEGYLGESESITLADAETLSVTVFLRKNEQPTRRCSRMPGDKGLPGVGDVALLALFAGGLLVFPRKH